MLSVNGPIRINPFQTPRLCLDRNFFRGTGLNFASVKGNTPRMISRLRLGFLFALGLTASAQTPATFGTPIPAPGNLTDIVLDESRQRLYLVNFANNRVEIYSIAERRFLNPVAVGTQPVSAALSPDNLFLYV